jgi:hypothetical protein
MYRYLFRWILQLHGFPCIVRHRGKLDDLKEKCCSRMTSIGLASQVDSSSLFFCQL